VVGGESSGEKKKGGRKKERRHSFMEGVLRRIENELVERPRLPVREKERRRSLLRKNSQKKYSPKKYVRPR